MIEEGDRALDQCEVCHINDVAGCVEQYRHPEWRRTWVMCDECAAATLLFVLREGFPATERWLEETSAMLDHRGDPYNEPT